MRKPIQIKGISTSSSYEDGECLSTMNVRHEQGVLKPVESFPIDFTLAHEYSLLYWHKNNEYKHLIGVRDNDKYRATYNYNAVYSLGDVVVENGVYYRAIQDYFTRVEVSETYYWEVISKDEVVMNSIYWIKDYGKPTETEVNLLSVSEKIVLSHIGNILNVLDDGVLKYVFWKDTEYLVINTDFDGAQSDAELIGKVDLRVSRKGTENERDVSMYYSTTNHHGAYNNDESSAEAIAQNSVSKGLFTRALKLEAENGNLHGFILAIIAIELFDGSYLTRSNPILLGQSLDSFTRYEDVYNYITNKATFADTALINEAGTVTTGIGTAQNTPVGFTNDTVNNRYVGKSDKQYRGVANQKTSDLTLDASIHEAPNLYAQLVQAESTGSSAIYCTISCNSLEFKVNTNIHDDFKSIVKSVSVFITPEISIYKPDTSKYTGSLYFSTYGAVRHRSWNWQPEIKTNAEIIEELFKLESFYKVHEIAFDDIKTTAENDGWVTIDLKGKLGDNLVAQERLNLDSFSNIKAKNQMTYNSMLHAWDINNVVSRGWPATYFYPQQGIGQFQTDPNEDIWAGEQLEYVEVTIKTDTGISKVVRYNSVPNGTALIGGLMPMLSYPDARATNMRIYKRYWALSNFELVKDYPLKANKYHNFAYYISPDLKPFDIGTFELASGSFILPTESNQQLSYQNKLKVSNVNNPFLFPDGQTYQVGDGKILNVGSQSIRTSDGQFGQYPLICFCSDGIFSLEVGDGTVAYSKAVKPQSYERPISSVICTTPFGIAFISNRGLCMVAGQEVFYLSETMFEEFRNINLQIPSEFPVGITNVFDFDRGSFNDYLKDCTAMIYNPKEHELIMVNKTKQFNYVYNFSTKQFYKNEEPIKNEIANSLPALQVWSGTSVKNVTTTDGGTRKVSFITRPIKMQTTDFKKFERIVLRGFLKNTSGVVACVWGSNDDRAFRLLRALTVTSDTRKDIDFGLFGKTSYRSYIIGLSMTTESDSEIEAIEMEIEKLYDSTKMR